MNGVLILDKPQGFTSFDAVAVMRRLCATKRIGHTGTLDPMATGVLPILIGSATRAADLLPETGKTYLAQFQLGVTTDTQDSSGVALTHSEFAVSALQLEAACEAFRGDILQVPPMYSAIKRNGVPLYDLARKGMEVAREARPIHIALLKVEAFCEAAGTGTLRVECSKGTYIRTLIADIGDALGCGGIMTALRREKACGFSLPEAITIEEARALAAAGTLAEKIRPVETLFVSMPALRVTEKQALRFGNGGELSRERLALSAHTADGTLFRVCSPEGDFLGLGRFAAETDELAVCKIFTK